MKELIDDNLISRRKVMSNQQTKTSGFAIRRWKISGDRRPWVFANDATLCITRLAAWGHADEYISAQVDHPTRASKD